MLITAMLSLRLASNNNNGLINLTHEVQLWDTLNRVKEKASPVTDLINTIKLPT